MSLPPSGAAPENSGSPEKCREPCSFSGSVILISVSGITMFERFVMVKRTRNSPGVSSLQLKSGDRKTSPSAPVASISDSLTAPVSKYSDASSASAAVAGTDSGSGAAKTVPQRRNAAVRKAAGFKNCLFRMAASFRIQCHGLQRQPVGPVISRKILNLRFKGEAVL